jgi:putative peptide zinc metalloprotease protein
MWPVLYTDTSDSWKLHNAKERLIIASAGVLSELMLALFATLFWCMAAEGPVKSMLYLLASTTWLTTLAINCSPFMRFDGYFVLTDLLDMPNLHARAGALATNWMRRTLFSLEEPDPEPGLPEPLKKKLVAFSIITWAYRFTVFLGIAVIVYHKFFKLLGIFLMLVEVIWFVARPIYVEIAALWTRRSLLRPRFRAFAVITVLLAVIIWLIPIASEVQAPAIVHARQEYAVYAPFPSQVVSVMVRPGQTVAAGTTLIELDSPDIAYRQAKAELDANMYAQELQRSPATRRLTEQVNVVEQQLGQALAEQKSSIDDQQRLVLKAPAEGVVRDMAIDLAPGRWVNVSDLMLRVVVPRPFVIDAYVGESQIRDVKIGQTVTFYPETTNLPVVKGTIQRIDTAALRTVPHILLASTNGGSIPATKNEQGALIADQAIYQVRIMPQDGGSVFSEVGRGTVRIDTEASLLVENFFSRVAALFIRESGF